MPQISHNLALAAVFEKICAVRGGAPALYPAHAYVRPGTEAHRMRLGPRQSERRVWTCGDELLVSTAGHRLPLPTRPSRPLSPSPARRRLRGEVPCA